MEKKNEKGLLDEQVRKIMYRAGYKINETPKYKPMIGDDLEFDEVPVNIHMTQDGQPMPNTGGSDAYLEEQGPEDELPAPEGPKEPAEPSNAPAPGEEDIPDEEPEGEPMDEPVEPEMGIEEPTEEIPTPPEEDVDQIQNDIIKHNIEAMKSIHSKLQDLENLNQQLNSQLNVLNAKVKEVEEPTNAEKLMSKKDVSYPFYFNLNDFWKGNWFDQQRNQLQEKGIRELPDGSFIADFDDLPTHSSMDIDDSFNSIV